MRPRLLRPLTLLALLVLVVAPPVLVGYGSAGRAEVAMKNRDFSRAAENYEQAARLLPWKSGLWEEAGKSKYQSGDASGAIPLLEHARSANGLSAEGWEFLGLAYKEARGDLPAAVEAWDRGLAGYPEYGRFYYQLALAYNELNDPSAELEALEQWEQTGGALDARASYRLGLLLALPDPDRALSELMDAAALDPDFDPAVQTMRTTLNLASREQDDSHGLVIVGRGLGLLEEWALAAEAFQQAVAADGGNAQAWAWLGESEQQLGREGSAQLERALVLGSEDPVVHSLQGLFWMRRGEPQNALSEYQQAAGLDPENPAWQVSIGEAYARLGDLPAALGAYTLATELAPEQANYWRLLAAFCVQYQVQVDLTGLPAARQALVLAPDDPQVLDTLGWTLQALGQPEQARYHLTQALEIAPEFALAHLHYGIVALQLGDYPEAQAHMKRAGELDPGSGVGAQAEQLQDQYFP